MQRTESLYKILAALTGTLT